MIPIGDDNPTFRTPIVTYALLASLGVVWLLFQGAGFRHEALAASVCNFGLVPGELTGRAALGSGVDLGAGMRCVVDDDPMNYLTPVTSMFLHGGWGHLLGNAVFLWVFGNNVEDAMGRFRFVVFYLLCGLGAAFAQVAVSPGSPVPMVGASGAISGILGGYLILYPRVPVRILFIIIFFIRIITVPAYLVLLWWIGYQLFLGVPQLAVADEAGTGGVAFFAHIGGFAMGLVLIKLFARKDWVKRHRELRRRRGIE
jgi:membrane associated rhomboid family serine protease